ncbi:MAG: HAD family hydrolase [Anaerolineae bacterium]|nr:HAD family hydrolase [Anaerolineae bacterium]
MSDNYKCVLFDWDLTLTRVIGDVSPEERLTALFQKEGLPYTLPEVEEAIHTYNKNVETGQLKRIGKKQTQREIAQFYKDVLAQLDHMELDWELVNRLYDAYSFLPHSLYEDTLPLLKWLKKQGIAIGIISNHSRQIRPVIEETLGQFVQPEHIILSQEEGVHKPTKTIFKTACVRMGFEPEACVFVGNDLYVDAIGAVASGGYGLGLWLDRDARLKGVPALPERVYRITSLMLVLDYIYYD